MTFHLEFDFSVVEGGLLLLIITIVLPSFSISLHLQDHSTSSDSQNHILGAISCYFRRVIMKHPVLWTMKCKSGMTSKLSAMMQGFQ